MAPEDGPSSPRLCYNPCRVGGAGTQRVAAGRVSELIDVNLTGSPLSFPRALGTCLAVTSSWPPGQCEGRGTLSSGR